MIEQVKVRVDTQLQATLERLQAVFKERPSWAEDVASAESLQAVAAAVLALPKTAPTAAEITMLLNAILALPQQSASPQAVEALGTAVSALAANVGILPREAASPSMLQGLGDLAVALRDEVRGQAPMLTQLVTTLAELREQQNWLCATCQRIESEVGALQQASRQTELVVARLNRPWYRRLFRT